MKPVTILIGVIVAFKEATNQRKGCQKIAFSLYSEHLPWMLATDLVLTHPIQFSHHTL